VRWLATCGEDPLGAVQQGRLSSQLFMLFAPRMLRVPRLTERREDLPILIATLLQRAAAEQGKKLRGITLDCLNLLLARQFPAEMSDLIAEISRLVTATPEGEMVRCEAHDVAARGDTSSPSDLPPELLQVLASNNLKDTIPRVEQLLIDRVMRQVKGNQSKGSRMLGISRGALITKLKEYGIPDYRYLRRRKAGGL
jgi:two-component system response regulator AtoC